MFERMPALTGFEIAGRFHTEHSVIRIHFVMEVHGRFQHVVRNNNYGFLR